ncbi:amino acid transporter [Intrasporangium chromatireducens Q5-1]|uniref:Amino acid transporter n=1 Tax=Intrasporangium chromatireducens Q5-1 TaxID=584657 RepID=W9GJP6_9MICO|nr:LysE/ArgO family amino acid transporter [Intrasporangium chromatireducens]EWT05008.1 amino acid transporter [Intrasporangium chromatireducens Q5-1]
MSSFIAPALAGLGTGAGLIVAIGPQNAYVLRQGLRRNGIVAVVLVCVLSDIALIATGVAGMGALAGRFPALLEAVRWGGAAFLVAYATVAARRALRPAALAAADAPDPTRAGVVLTAVALTWLNPHVYLDTMVLIGSVAATKGDPGRWAFAAGAMLASVLWFTLLGLGARALSGVLGRPTVWRLVDGLIAVQMLVVAAGLLLTG